MRNAEHRGSSEARPSGSASPGRMVNGEGPTGDALPDPAWRDASVGAPPHNAPFFKAVVPLALGIAFLLCLPARAWSQERVPELRASIGYWKTFLDEPGSIAVGGSLRVPVVWRLGVQPEFLWTDTTSYRHMSFIPNVVLDLGQPAWRAVPYLIGGFGVHRTLDKRIHYSYNEATGAAGIGVRVRAGKRVLISSDFRLGSNAFPLVTVGVGFALR